MPIIDPSYTIAEFCAAEHITAPTFYKLKRAGLGPKEMRHGAAIRISHRARLEWQEAREKPTEEQHKIDERLRERARAISTKSVASPQHVSKTRRSA